jgi:hypothetical protein
MVEGLKDIGNKAREFLDLMTRSFESLSNVFYAIEREGGEQNNQVYVIPNKKR